ncbi:hypothetical protein AAOE16_03055 [Ekhidna sp. MALMAid0563]|uniref:hypothetical protein n=1 Tax=Ekhidna sp. MALMAid0563 TaxID=3143937 RepID=UPI0032DFB810
MKRKLIALITLLILFSCSSDDGADMNDDELPDGTIELTCETGGMLAEVSGEFNLDFVALGTSRDEPDGDGYISGSTGQNSFTFKAYQTDENGNHTHQIEISSLTYNGVGVYEDCLVSFNDYVSESYYQVDDGTIEVTDIDYITNDYGCISITFSGELEGVITITGELKMETDI